MKITESKILEIKIKLVIKGTGSKRDLAKHLGVNKCDITRLLKTGMISEKHIDKLNEWVK